MNNSKLINKFQIRLDLDIWHKNTKNIYFVSNVFADSWYSKWIECNWQKSLLLSLNKYIFQNTKFMFQFHEIFNNILLSSKKIFSWNYKKYIKKHTYGYSGKNIDSIIRIKRMFSVRSTVMGHNWSQPVVEKQNIF